MKTTTPKEKALAKVRAAQKKADIVSKAFGPPPSGNVATTAQPVLNVQVEPGQTDARALINANFSPAVGASLVALDLTHADSKLDLTTAAAYFKAAGTEAAGGDLSKSQEVLAIQVRTLDLLFNYFLRRGAVQPNFEVKESYLRLALKAQSQCRTTVESLAVIQQGPAIFAKNANINNGQQQVNNGVPAPAAPKAIDASPTEVLQPVPARARKQKAKVTNQTIGAVSK
ncbi:MULTISPECIES: hypothetical protein [unclassified Variovorax]|uniref:hypothetical protein n=1 Tax=unclassified Variovorax TaxID=663243 RepID=UPI000ACF8371|nr:MULTISPECIES: hypothetical protein [unclassified Variovorax]PNG46567.1 hypothetical protein CHC06_06910 [Variovorax sp. B2]PNG47611.1 hypothetical protein CHC07_06777 [Variovorax sp. B4]VTV14335.1 hypothetical protein WDL1CHR_04883 [Variovorax sp. WDL1]